MARLSTVLCCFDGMKEKFIKNALRRTDEHDFGISEFSDMFGKPRKVDPGSTSKMDSDFLKAKASNKKKSVC